MKPLISETNSSFKWFILATATFVTMLYAMNVTIASIALSDMRGAMGATQDQISWVVTGNIVATAIFTPFAGWLSSRIQIRTILIFSVLGFIISSIFFIKLPSIGLPSFSTVYFPMFLILSGLNIN